MDLLSSLRLLRRNWLLILLSLIIGATSAAVITVNTPPKYAATITMMVNSTKIDAAGRYQPVSLQQVKSYGGLLSSRRLISQIVDNEDEAGALQQNITAQAVPETMLLRATVTDGDPVRATRLADALGARFAKMVQEIEGATGVSVMVVDQPRAPTEPVSPSPLSNVAFGLLIALLIGVGSIFLRDRLDITVKTSEALQQSSQSPTLGIIGYEKDARRHPLIVRDRGSSLRSAAYRSLCANLQFIGIDGQPKSLMVTSCLPNEGKSLTSSNLAIALAQSGGRVILIDGDLRRPCLPDYFGIDGAVGLTDVLIGKAQLDDVVQRCGELDLYVLPSGQTPPNPSELLGSRGMRQLLEGLTKSYDMVVIDAPPLLPVINAATLAAACDGALLVARYGKTRQEHLVRAQELLSSANARVVGTVLNAVPAKASGHGHGHETESSIKREVKIPVSG
ncbi:polysaccharide biosynthesis tyrosine autokinase [Nonomuraea basaltis]|uniref:polysaccharide biosynthesis tyrosine autokinase n=1 Tax=Nonomuraea basaltis TaxID=2495887 RepID=UPI0023F47765|nr:polysaccharide biosynthesis tyrosine autokinase [Nonomuraea basaltis]